jgi:hypothetical protein
MVASLDRSLGAFALPGLDLVLHRTMNVAELAGWAVPLLVPLAVLGAVRCRENHGARLFALSALLTLAGYSIVSFDQGHGWGFRYFHSAWAAVPLLAAGAMESAQTSPGLRRMAIFAALCSLVLGTALRFAQVRTFMDAHLAQIPAPSGGREVVFVKKDGGSYTVDLVQNDPFLESKRWVLISFGDAEDSRLMGDVFPTAKRAMLGPFGSLWRIE